VKGNKSQVLARDVKIKKVQYGVMTEKIRELEERLDKTYDRICDEHKPVLWPDLPLKL